MTNIRRYFQPSNICFLTHVTYNRLPILLDHADLIQAAMDRIINNNPSELIAWAILPDHCHFLLNPGEQHVPTLMQRFKLSFSMNYHKQAGIDGGRVWQHRYWDYIIRNEHDMQACFDYIHFNPVKHGFIRLPFEWVHSSARDYLRMGYYSDDWMNIEGDDSILEFGE